MSVRSTFKCLASQSEAEFLVSAVEFVAPLATAFQPVSCSCWNGANPARDGSRTTFGYPLLLSRDRLSRLIAGPGGGCKKVLLPRNLGLGLELGVVCLPNEIISIAELLVLAGKADMCNLIES